jgi:hypothetical protein
MTLCRSLDIPVEYAAGQNRLTLPPAGPFSASAQFTLPILRVTTEKGPIWLTLGSKYAPFGYVPAEVRGMPAFLLLARGPKKTEIPAEGTPDNVRYEGELRLGADGTADVDLALRFQGKYASGLRASLSQLPEEQVRDAIESSLLGRELRGFELASYKLDNFDDPDQPLVIRARGRVRNFAQRSGTSLLISPPFTPRITRLAALAARQTPLLLVDATHQELKLDVKLPDGAHLESSLKSEDVKDGDREVVVNDAVSNGGLVLSRTVSLPAGRVQPKDYPAFVEFARRADDALSQSVRLSLR